MLSWVNCLLALTPYSWQENKEHCKIWTHSSQCQTPLGLNLSRYDAAHFIWTSCLRVGWEHHAVHAAVWQRHLRIWTGELAGTRQCVCVCERQIGIQKSVCECACGRLLACKLVLVCLLRAVSAEGTERSSPLSWIPSDISLSNNGVALTPFLIMQNLSFTPETQSTKASNGVHRHTQDPPPPPPTCFIWTLIYYYC